MNDTPIKRFCMQAHETLLCGVELRMQRCGIVLNDTALSRDDAMGQLALSPREQRQRAELLELQREMGHTALAERVAYTWFNRIVAIRYMEVHDYLPSHIRLLSKADGNFGSQAIDEVFDLCITGLDMQRVLELKQAGDDEALFRYLLITQCGELSECLPDLFEPTDSALELLLPDKLMAREGVIEALVRMIPESDWLSGVEILGYMYQCYNPQKKEGFSNTKTPVATETLISTTQLLTPEWIVRYLVQNSLGRLWMLNNPQSTVRQQMEFYIEPEDEYGDFIHITDPKEISLCDPACGSGRMLIYAFDLLFAMYEERGYSEHEIPQLILQYNVVGFEVNERAAQLASLALVMRSREHDRRFFKKGTRANIMMLRSFLPEGSELSPRQTKLSEDLAHLDEIGSLLSLSEEDVAHLRADFSSYCDNYGAVAEGQCLKEAISACEMLSREFDIVLADPPHLGSKERSPFLNAWLKESYPSSKTDLAACFMERAFVMCKRFGYSGLTLSKSWMFLSSFEELRTAFLKSQTMESLIQLSAHGLRDISTQMCAFVTRNVFSNEYQGSYIRLTDFDHWSLQETKALEAIRNPHCSWRYDRHSSMFERIATHPIAYWVSEELVSNFDRFSPLAEVARPRQGLSTGDGKRFFRSWWETNCSMMSFSLNEHPKWFPFNKGSSYRKWYGSNESVVDWEDDGSAIKSCPGSAIRNPDFYMREGATWGTIPGTIISMRYCPDGFFFGSGAGMCFADSRNQLMLVIAIVNSSVAMAYLVILCATLSYSQGPLGLLPIAHNCANSRIGDLAEANIELSKLDWDSFETSWGFKRHPLV